MNFKSLLKIETLSESVKIQITESINDFVWTKEIVQEWVKDKNVILEGWWDDFKSGFMSVIRPVANIASKIVPFVAPELAPITSAISSAVGNGLIGGRMVGGRKVSRAALARALH